MDFKGAFHYLGRLQRLTGRFDQRNTAQVVALLVRYAGLVNGIPDETLWLEVHLLQVEWQKELIDPSKVSQIMSLVSRFPPSEQNLRLLELGDQLLSRPSSEAVEEWIDLLDTVAHE